MKLSHPTPWLRKQISDADRLLIELAEPRDAGAHLGYSHGWTCRIRHNRVVVGEAYKQPTIRGAFKAAQADMKERVA